tara:strand:- start:785 stop:1525 length:741 start_codon:yes stop_codon:yes gene_type:complete
MRRIEILDCPVDIATTEETLEYIVSSVDQKKFIQHGVVNVAKMINMRKDKELRDAVSSCDIINVDGMGVVLGARFLGYDIPHRVTGIDLFHRLIDISADKNYPIYLLGATEEVVSLACSKLIKDTPGLRIVGFHHGYFWEDEEEVVESIRKSGAKLLFVAITSPKKEVFINKWGKHLGVHFAMGVGGTFDIVAGKTRRAPVFMQNSGLEWLYRIIQEPRRMWKRYLYTNLYFLYLIIKYRIWGSGK